MTQTTRFSDRVALVTGAGSGIGRACALRLAAEGAFVFVHGRTAAKLAETVSLIGRAAMALPGDISVPDDNIRVTQAVASEHGRLDILVNNAGSGEMGPADRLTTEDFQRMLNVNLVGLFDLTRGLAPLLRNGHPTGAVVNVASTLALTPAVGTLAYSCSKAGVVAATEVLAAEWAPQIRVNCICPGFVDTPIHSARDPKPSPDEARAFLDKIGGKHPLRRVGRPEEVAAAVAWLASEECAWVTGSTLVFDGGWTVARR